VLKKTLFQYIKTMAIDISIMMVRGFKKCSIADEMDRKMRKKLGMSTANMIHDRNLNILELREKIRMMNRVW
jgi:hypothetical protein